MGTVNNQVKEFPNCSGRKENEQCDKTTFQDLPEITVEKIMGYLNYQEVNKLGVMCRVFRRTASTILRTGLRNLVARIERVASEIEDLAIEVTPLTIREHLHVALLHTVLRILLAEAHMLKAVCWRYVRDSIDFCFPGGNILDEFTHVINMVRDREINKELEPEITTRLFLKAERFYDLFENIIEPSIVRLYCLESTPGGIKIMDVLDCCQNASYRINVTHSSGEGPFHMSALYELRDVSTLDAPPNITEHVTSEMKLRTICRYLRNNVRWINLFQPLKELWDLEDNVEHGSDELKVKALFNYRKYHQARMTDIFPDTEEAQKAHLNNMEFYHVRDSLPGSNGLCEDEFTREIASYRSSYQGMACNIILHGKTVKQLPMKYEFLVNSTPSPSSSIVNGNCIVSEESESKDKFSTEEFNLRHTKKSEEASASKPCSDEDYLDADNFSKKKFEFTPSQSKFIHDGFGWPLTSEESGKNYDFYLQMIIQYPALSGSDLIRETIITVRQVNNDVFITSDGDVVPYY